MSFTDDEDVLFLFEILPERKLAAKSLVCDELRLASNILTSWSINPNEIVFIKVKALSDNQMQVSKLVDRFADTCAHITVVYTR